MYESNTRLGAEVVDDIKRFLETGRNKALPWSKAVLFRTRIRRNIKLAESPSHGQSIFEYGPKTAGAVDYSSLAAEVLGLDEAVAEAAPQSQTQARSQADARDESAPPSAAPNEGNGDSMAAQEQVASPSGQVAPRGAG
jgi:chromosome partitioning protein